MDASLILRELNGSVYHCESFCRCQMIYVIYLDGELESFSSALHMNQAEAPRVRAYSTNRKV